MLSVGFAPTTPASERRIPWTARSLGLRVVLSQLHCDILYVVNTSFYTFLIFEAYFHRHVTAFIFSFSISGQLRLS